jgi:hypothetical protein
MNVNLNQGDTMKKKLFVIKRNGDVIASLLTQRAVLAQFNHATLKAWMKYALLNQWHGIAANNVDQNTANVWTLHRIQ